MKKLVCILVMSILVITAVGCSADDSDGSEALPGLVDVGQNPDSEIGSGDILDDSSALKTVNIADRKTSKSEVFSISSPDFDEAMQSIETTAEKAQAEAVNKYQSGESPDRQYTFVYWVPNGKLGAFSSEIGSLDYIDVHEYTDEDYEGQYSFVESRIKYLDQEKQNLSPVLAQAASIEDKLALEERISSISSELEFYQKEIKRWDKSDIYAKVSITLSEMSKMDYIYKQDLTFSQRIRESVRVGFENFGIAVKDAAVWLVSIMLFLMIAMVAAIIVLIIVLRSYWTRKG